jgi:hypothetical protein
MNFLAAVFMLFQVGQSAQTPQIPAVPGIYFMQDDGKWVGIPKASAEARAKGLALFVETGGYTNLGTDVALPGAKSAIRIAAPRPVFYVREVGRSKDVILIQLKQKGESRTFRTSSGDATVENKNGFRKADIRKAAVTEYPDGTFSITPERELKPGEYMLVLGDTAAGFDFGIDLKK